MKLFRFGTSFFLISLLSLSLTGDIQSKESKYTLKLNPSFLTVRLEETERTVSETIILENVSTEQLSIRVYPLGGVQQEGSGKVRYLEDAGSSSFGLSEFVNISPQSFQLRAGTKKEVLVTIQNTSDLSAGGHFAGIVFEAQSPTQKSADLIPSVATQVFVNKAGITQGQKIEVEKLSWPSWFVAFSYPQAVKKTVKNTGDMHIIPHGRLEIRDIFKRTLYKGVINQDSVIIFPQNSRTLQTNTQALSYSLPLSINQLSIEGKDSMTGTLYRYSAGFVYMHPAFILFFIVIVGIGVYYRKVVKQFSTTLLKTGRIFLKNVKQSVTKH